MEKRKLKLDQLKVQSFVTEYDKEGAQTLNIKGGYTNMYGDCRTIIGCGGGGGGPQSNTGGGPCCPYYSYQYVNPCV